MLDLLRERLNLLDVTATDPGQPLAHPVVSRGAASDRAAAERFHHDRREQRDGEYARRYRTHGPISRIAEKTRRVAELWLSEGGAKGGGALPVGQGLANDFMALSQQLLANPMALVETQAEFWQDYLTLWRLRPSECWASGRSR